MIMGKLYFGIRTVYINVKSTLIVNFFRIWGFKCGKGTVMNKKPIVAGYLNKIQVGNKCSFHEGVRIVVNKEGRLKIGDRTLISSNVNINAGVGNITIGANTMIAANTYIINSDHNVYDTLSVRDTGHRTKDIRIGNNVWIGANCIILKGVNIGDGAIIGAGSIVTKDVRPYSINHGTPCRFTKFRFSKNVLDEKLRQKEKSYE